DFVPSGASTDPLEKCRGEEAKVRLIEQSGLCVIPTAEGELEAHVTVRNVRNADDQRDPVLSCQRSEHLERRFWIDHVLQGVQRADGAQLPSTKHALQEFEVRLRITECMHVRFEAALAERGKTLTAHVNADIGALGMLGEDLGDAPEAAADVEMNSALLVRMVGNQGGRVPIHALREICVVVNPLVLTHQSRYL